MATNLVNYYKILQVDPEADIEVIEAAYKRLALKYHPDVNKSSNAEEKMKSLNEARKVLANSQERRKYDVQFSQNAQRQKKTASRGRQETAEEDVWDDKAIRTLATQILIVIQQSLNDKKWRIAKEKLHAFEGLGIPSKDSPLPTIPSTIPEWQSAKLLEEKATRQASEFLDNLKKRFFILDGIIAIIVIISVAIIASNDPGVTGAVIVGAMIGIPILIAENLFFAGAYTKRYAGKWGEGTDYVLGLLTPFIFWLTAGLILIPIIFAPFTYEEKKR